MKSSFQNRHRILPATAITCGLVLAGVATFGDTVGYYATLPHDEPLAVSLSSGSNSGSFAPPHQISGPLVVQQST